jgi:NADH-quinone oxidoreductase subunit L
MPITAMTFIIGWLAIAGVSADRRASGARTRSCCSRSRRARCCYVVGLVTALLTAYYMTRQVIMVFFGEARLEGPRGRARRARRPHAAREPRPPMLLPLVVLAGLSIVGGVIQLPFSDDVHFLEKWLHPVVEFGERDVHGTWAYENKYVLLVLAAVVAIVGILAAFAVYQKRRMRAIEPAILERGWYYDRGISGFMGGPGRRAFDALAWFDARSSTARSTEPAARARLGGGVRKAQSGYVRQYASALAVGVVLLLVWFVVVRGIVG